MFPNPSSPITPSTFAGLPEDDQKRLALEIFYLVLRDAGRDHNDPESDGYGNYDSGKAAIALFSPVTPGRAASIRRPAIFEPATAVTSRFLPQAEDSA